MAAVEIRFTNQPGGMAYTESSWWIVTSGRNPDVPVDGPFASKEDARKARRNHPYVQRGPRGYYTNV